VHATLFDEAGLSLRFELPAEARPVDVAGLPPIDVSRLPGASLVGRVAFETDALRAGGGCARGPSDRFVPGIEGVLFEKATWFALRGAALEPVGLEQRGAESAPSLERRTLRGRDGERVVVVEHVLSFVGPDSDVLLCSTVCVGDAAGCERAARIEVEGAPSPPPTPALWMRAALGAIEHPHASLVGLGLAAAGVVALVLAKRPRDP
jgi:hypothetical protein